MDYYIKDNKFVIEIVENWADGVSGKTIDDTLYKHEKFNWKRIDNIDIDEFKAYMIIQVTNYMNKY
jgi:hypothetical protein